MQYLIKNPKQDMNGNIKENIFIAYDEEGNVLGNAYLYPVVNHYQTYATPHMIYFDVYIGIENERLCKDSLQSAFYDVIMERALVIRKEREDLKTRLYTGCINDTYKLNCLKEKGFDDDCTIIMATDIKTESFKNLKDVQTRTIELGVDTSYKNYEKDYNKLFITPLSTDMIQELQSSDYFSCKEVIIDNKPIGSYTVYTDNGLGYIETLFVRPDYIGQGHSKVVLECALTDLQSQGVKKAELEVWKSNERATHLYKGYGFKEIAKNIMFPGIDL
jgi:ribosomal protein S18 acetylase RimI-like enzyme